MSRVISSGVITEIATNDFRMCHLLEINLATPIYYTDSPQDIVYDSNTFLASGHILQIEAIQEASDIRVGSSKIKLSGVEQTFVNLMLAGGYSGRQVRILRAFLNDTNQIIGDPFLLYDGRIEGHQIKDSNTTSEVILSISSHWSDFEKKSGRKTNSNSQALYFSTDKGFDFSALVNKDIKWGRP